MPQRATGFHARLLIDRLEKELAIMVFIWQLVMNNTYGIVQEG